MTLPAELSSAERQAFFQSVENVRGAALAHLAQQARAGYPIAFYTNVQRGIDDIMQAAVQRDGGMACRFGCSYCCHARVEASAPEVFRVAAALMERSPGEVARVMERMRPYLAANAEKTRWAQRLACPFLSNNLCTIYEIRPAGCRKAHSLDLDACRTGADVLPQDLNAVLAVEAITRGTAEAYQAVGLDTGQVEFISALQIALTDTDARSRWLAGQRVF